jgi:hypothetical protein
MKTVLPILLAASLIFTSRYEGSTLSSVVMSGGIIKAQNSSVDKKYPRKDCPICKGTGKYLSGDGIKMVDCGYCEPPKIKDVLPAPIKTQTKPQCTGSNCPLPKTYPNASPRVYVR